MAVAVLGVLAVALLLWQRPWQQGNAAGADGDVVALPADASVQLTAQLRGLSESASEDEFVVAAGDLADGRAFGRRTWRSLQAVAQPGATFRYISGGEVADREDGSTSAVVEVAWQPSSGSGLDPAVTHRSTVRLRAVPETDGTFSLTSAERESAAVPVWLLGSVSGEPGPDSAVIRIDGGDDELPVDAMTTTARAAVQRVVPDVSGDLTIISPRTQDQMADLVGQDSEAVAQIAAVTTGIDGGSDTDDIVIVLNPSVFATMDRRAAQVVLSHEATHALTAAVGTSAAGWVVEGFADYVALRDDTAPLAISAGQVLAEVRAGRVPSALPAEADFGSDQHGLGAVYESAWMAFRLLGERYSDAEIVDFYRDVIGGEPVEQSVVETLGTTTAQLTADWRDYLTKSASTVS